MANPYEEYLNRIKAAESGGNKYAKNPFKGQTASGLFQFTKGTWEGMGYDWKDRFDEQKQIEAATKFTKYNDDYLKRKLGIQPNYADLYGAHFLGAAGYAKLYKASNEQPISSVMSPQEINVNPSYTKNKDGTLKTVGEVKAILAKKTGTAVPQTNYSKQQEVQEQEAQFTLEANRGDLETAGEYKEPKEVSEAKQELVQAQNEENFMQELQQIMQPQQTQPEQEQFNYLQSPEAFTLYDPQIQYIEQQPVMYAQEGGMISVKPSNIQGKGAFINRDIREGELIGLAHTNEQPSTELGKYHNHSENPNSENIKIGNQRFLVSLRPLKQGEEITVDYRMQPELEQPEDFKTKSKNNRFKNA